jgi:hypothetical protein
VHKQLCLTDSALCTCERTQAWFTGMKKTHENKKGLLCFTCVCECVLCIMQQQRMYDTHYVLSQRNNECRVHLHIQLLFQRHFMMLSLEERGKGDPPPSGSGPRRQQQ